MTIPEHSSASMRPVHRLRIFVVDDHPVLRVGLKALINAQFTMEAIGEAADGQTAYREIVRLQPDLVIMDLSLPGMNGARTTERLKRTCPQVKVLMLTVHEEKSYILDGLSAGACGYVLKRTPTDELIRAICAVDSGGIYLDPAIAHKVVNDSLHTPSNHEFAQGVDLTEREAQALRLIALGYSIKEIAAQMGISGKTVETYRTRFMNKLEFDSRTDIVRYALHRGWLHDS
jgi:two-component system response regulator NreC